jgi:hypothetical protein
LLYLVQELCQKTDAGRREGGGKLKQ